MLTRARIETAKENLDVAFFTSALSVSMDERSVLFTLENLGRLPSGFDGKLFVPLLKHPNPDVRLAASKNIGKVKDESLLNQVIRLCQSEPNTLVRREMISAIGRMRSSHAVPFLKESLKDEDPKVILQAIRALLYFKEDLSVRDALLRLANHPNELIQSAIMREFSESRNGRASQINHASSPDELKNVILHADVREAVCLGLVQK